MLGWWGIVLVAVVGILLLSALMWAVARRYMPRDPYKKFMQLRLRRKLTFVNLLLRDRRVPLYVKAIPLLLGNFVLCLVHKNGFFNIVQRGVVVFHLKITLA